MHFDLYQYLIYVTFRKLINFLDNITFDVVL